MNLDHHNLYDHDHIIMSSRALPSSFFIITVVITITISNLFDILSLIMYCFFFKETVNRGNLRLRKSGNLVEVTRRHASRLKLYIFFKLPPALLLLLLSLLLTPSHFSKKQTITNTQKCTCTKANTQNKNTHKYKHTLICKCVFSHALTPLPFNKYQVHAESFTLLTSCLEQPPPEHRGGRLPFPAALWGRQFRQSTL